MCPRQVDLKFKNEPRPLIFEHPAHLIPSPSSLSESTLLNIPLGESTFIKSPNQNESTNVLDQSTNTNESPNEHTTESIPQSTLSTIIPTHKHLRGVKKCDPDFKMMHQLSQLSWKRYFSPYPIQIIYVIGTVYYHRGKL